MLFKSVAAAAGLVSLAQASAPLAAKDYYLPECPAESDYTSVVISTQVIAYPVVINQYFDHNTFIIINGGVTININNAPTTLSTTVTATTTTTVTSTVGPAVQTPFLIQVQGALAKRQNSPSYIGAGGVIVSSCSQAADFTINTTGELLSGGDKLSTNTGNTEQLFAVSSTVGDITTFFSGNGGFSWTNKAFFNDAATFCSKGNLLFSEFTSTIPDGCRPIVLLAVPATGCSSSTTNSMTTSFTSSLTTSTMGPFSNSTMTM